MLPVLKTESIKITDKQINWEPSFGILSFWKFVLIFPLFIGFCFSLYTDSLSNSFLKLFLTFSQISLYFLIIHHLLLIFSVIKVFSICAYFWEKYTKTFNFFSIFVANEIFKIFLPKEALLGTTVWLVSIFFTEISPICWWRFYFWITISTNFIIFFHFHKRFQKFLYIFLIYNFPLF